MEICPSARDYAETVADLARYYDDAEAEIIRIHSQAVKHHDQVRALRIDDVKDREQRCKIEKEYWTERIKVKNTKNRALWELKCERQERLAAELRRFVEAESERIRLGFRTEGGERVGGGEGEEEFLPAYEESPPPYYEELAGAGQFENEVFGELRS